MTKKMVWTKKMAPSMEMACLRGSPEDIATMFREEQVRVAEQYGVADPSTITFEAEYYGYDGGVEMFVCFMREETDEEYEYRMNKETAAEKRAAQKEAKERAQYEKLKAKYGE